MVVNLSTNFRAYYVSIVTMTPHTRLLVFPQLLATRQVCRCVMSTYDALRISSATVKPLSSFLASPKHILSDIYLRTYTSVHGHCLLSSYSVLRGHFHAD